MNEKDLETLKRLNACPGGDFSGLKIEDYPELKNLEKTNLENANLSGANLNRANFDNANLINANLST